MLRTRPPATRRARPVLHKKGPRFLEAHLESRGTRNLARRRANSRWAAGASPFHLDVELLFDASRVHVHGAQRQSNRLSIAQRCRGRRAQRSAALESTGRYCRDPPLPQLFLRRLRRLDALLAGACLDLAEHDATVFRGLSRNCSP